MTPDELVEKVARALYYTPIAGTSGVIPTWETVAVDVQEQYRSEAAAAIAVVMEDAARVAEAFPARTHGNLASAPYAAAEQASDEIAAAILAMKGSPNAE